MRTRHSVDGPFSVVLDCRRSDGQSWLMIRAATRFLARERQKCRFCGHHRQLEGAKPISTFPTKMWVPFKAIGRPPVGKRPEATNQVGIVNAYPHDYIEIIGEQKWLRGPIWPL
jgi:hypothetical protein